MNRSGLFSPVLISLPALIVLVLLALTTTPTAVHGFGLSCTANSTGAWDVAATWINCNDTYPGEGDQVNIAGSEVQVTIRAGLSVNVQSISINSYGGLINKGDLRAVWLDVNDGAVRSTGSLQLVDTDESAAYLRTSYAIVELSRDLTIAGLDEAFMQLGNTKATFGGSINVTAGQYAQAYAAVLSNSRVSVAGDVTVLGGCYDYNKKRETNNENDDSVVEGGEKQKKKKRGFSLDGSGLAVDYDSFLQVGGDVELTTRDFTDNSTTGSTREVSLYFDGGDVVIGGDLLVQSGDSLLADTGDASISTGDNLFDLVENGWTPSEYDTGSLIVGGSVTVKSGSVSGLRNESNQYGYRAGEAWINLVKGFLLANGSQSTITVQSGNTGPSTYYGQSGEDAYVQLGFGSQLAATKDLIVQAGHGGDAGLGQTAGEAGSSSLIVAYGGDVLVGGNLHIVGGNGGNNSMDATESSVAGEGGQANVMMMSGGSINVAADLLVAPGSAGQAAVGASAYTGSFYLGPAMGGGGACKERGCILARNDNKRGVSSDFVSTGDMNAPLVNDGWRPNMGGLVVENVWEGEIIIGGDLRVTGCNAGSSVEGSGGQSAVVSIVSVSGGVTLDVYGSVVIEGGNGGSVVGGGSNGGDAGSAMFEVSEHSLVNVGGSVTVTGGAGGDVINGTGSGGSIYESSQLAVWARAHVVVGDGKGAITIIGGRGGNVYAENTPNSMGYGGSPSSVYLGLYDSSSVTAGDVRLVGSSMGNATVNGSAPVPPPPAPVPIRAEPAQVAREAAESTPSGRHATKSAAHHKTTEREKRGKGFNSNPELEVDTRSWAIINGDLELLPGSPFFHNLNSPEAISMSIISADDLSTITVNGDVTVRGAAGAHVSSSSPYTLFGGIALVELSDGAVLQARGDMLLQGGDAGHDFANASITGFKGATAFELNNGAHFHQSGLVRLIDGQGLELPWSPGEGPFPIGVSVYQGSEWTVYPCAGAGLEASGNSTYFQVRELSTFRDCRGSGAKQHYPEPLTDGSADGSCSPCTCTAAPFNACPEEAAAGSVHNNNFVVACLHALAALLL
ncbi:uncharacterized protein ACA1_374720 [Acanthamoeba castellanii str. Neff]|uniref:Uncharacterized protein n=1 Tax=Acanthamoeba castellanii (strain ATCC 30010 / Neff) TaxID=1257118 RepID=L8GI09_ACACF|nr:uncharacterized protein ACA1_374720 [Acanthamoeba castellanii str. Neff]ELR12403.1 hypothetical protein ACA1_374720 [Acanthamoeba castellanii str. Neff]